MSMKIISCQTGIDTEYKHWHKNEDNMIIFIHSGSGSIVCNERVYPIKEGALCFIGANKYHYTVPDDAIVYRRSKVFISDGKLSRILSLVSESDAFAHDFHEDSFVYAEIPTDKIPAVDALLRDMSHHANDRKCRDAIFVSCFLRLLGFIAQNALDAISNSPSSLHRAIEYINQSIEKPLSIDQICEYVHISKYHFCRSFKKATGLTVMQYILNTRVVLAKHMLETEGLSIIEISEQCGFSSVSYFCRAFKEATLMTPLQYKKRHAKAAVEK